MTAGKTIQSKDYYGAFAFADNEDLGMKYVKILQFDLEESPYDFIIGMNVLCRWSFTYDSTTKLLTLSDGQ